MGAAYSVVDVQNKLSSLSSTELATLISNRNFGIEFFSINELFVDKKIDGRLLLNDLDATDDSSKLADLLSGPIMDDIWLSQNGKDLSKYNKKNYNTIDDLKNDLVKSIATVSSVAKKAGEESDYPFPKEGVTLRGFQRFIDDVCGGRDKIQGYTTTDVCNKCLIEKMSENKTSYVEYLQSIDDPDVGLASVFVSHAWKYNFLDVFDALLNHFENYPDRDSIFIWFDLFSNNQIGAPSLSFLWWSTTFRSAIETFGHTVFILSPWNDPIPFTRVWCLFEVFCTVDTKSKFEVCMSPKSKAEFVDAIRIDFESINTMIANVDVRNSDAWNSEDLVRIFYVISSSVGFDHINSTVFDQMRKWIVDTTIEAIAIANGNEKLEESCQLSLSLAELYIMLGKFDEAETIIFDSQQKIEYSNQLLCRSLFLQAKLSSERGNFSESNSFYNQLVNDHNLETVYPILYDECSINMIDNFKRIGQFKIAETIAVDYLPKLEAKYGRQHVMTLDMMEALGEVYNELGKYSDAEVLLLEVVPMREKLLGKSHPDTLNALENLAYCFELKGLFKKSLPYYEKLYLLRKIKFGEDSPVTLKSANALAGIYDELAIFEKAEPLYLQTLELRLLKLGPAHADYLETRITLAGLRFNQGRLEEAEEEYLFCIDQCREHLGHKHPLTLSAIHYLGELLTEEQEDPEEGEQYNIEAYEGRLELLGENHVETLESKMYVAICRYYLAEEDEDDDDDDEEEDDEEKIDEKAKQAMDLIKDVLNTFERTVGLNHPKALQCQQILAEFYWGQEDYATSEKLLLDALNRSISTLGDEVQSTIHIKKELAMLYADDELDKDFDVIEKLLDDVIVGYRHLYGPNHEYTTGTIESYAEACINFEAYEKAKELLLQCFDDKKTKYGIAHKKTLSIISKLASCCSKLDSYDQASKYYELLIDNAKIVLQKRNQKLLKKYMNQYKKFKDSSSKSSKKKQAKKKK